MNTAEDGKHRLTDLTGVVLRLNHRNMAMHTDAWNRHLKQISIHAAGGCSAIVDESPGDSFKEQTSRCI